MAVTTRSRAARSRARLQEAEAAQVAKRAATAEKEAEAQRYSLSIVSESTLAVLHKCATSEARRIPSALAALAAPADVATDTLLALSETDTGRRALHSLTVESRASAAHCAAEAVARLTARRIVSNMLRSETIAPETDAAIRRSAIVTAEALTSGRSASEAEAVAAALKADGPIAKPDRDHQRAYALSTAGAHGYGAGKRAARQLAAEAAPDQRPRCGATSEAQAGAASERAAVKRERRTMRAIREQTTPRAIRLIREADLATLLDQSLRAAPDRTDTATSGRTLAALVDTREAGAAFRHSLRRALDSVTATIRTRGIRGLRAALDSLAALTADQCADRAVMLTSEAEALRQHADSMAEAAPAFRRGMTQRERTQRDAASAADREADRSEALAALAVSLAEVRTQRPLSLLDVIEAALTSAADAGAHTGGARARGARGQAPDATTIDGASVRVYLNLGGADSESWRALSTVIARAADVALDAAGAVTLSAAHHDSSEAGAASNIDAALQRLAYGRHLLAVRRTVTLRQRAEAQRLALAEAGADREARGRYVPEALSPAQRDAAGAIVRSLLDGMRLA